MADMFDKKVKITISSGYCGVPDKVAVVEVSDSAERAEIQHVVEEAVLNMIDYSWELIDDLQEDG